MAEIIIYSTPTCPYCIQAKKFFKDNKIKFKEFNVFEDEKAREEMIHKSGQIGVPVIDINGTIIIGFKLEEIKKKLGIK